VRAPLHDAAAREHDARALAATERLARAGELTPDEAEAVEEVRRRLGSPGA
jgi:hypothetical protein